MGLFDSLFAPSKEKQELAQWIVDHNTFEYLGNYVSDDYSYDDYCYYCEVKYLREIKDRMLSWHNQFEHKKAHPKPKIGDTFEVYICGNRVSTIRNVTNVSSNQNGVFFTVTNEDGSTNLKPFFGNVNNIHWTRV